MIARLPRVWFGVAAALVTGAATGASYFVDPAGVAKNSGTDEQHPVPTVAALLKKVTIGCGDTINLRAGNGVVHGPQVFPASMACDCPPGRDCERIQVRPYGAAPEVKAVLDASHLFTVGAQPIAWQALGDGVYVSVNAHGPPAGTNCSNPKALEISGVLLGSQYRLIQYQHLEDLTALNLSYPNRGDDNALKGVSTSDSRIAGGTLIISDSGLPKLIAGRKIPWTYLGPGFHWRPGPDCKGNIRVRLIPTGIETPGIQDYTGKTDPAEVPLAFTIGAEDDNALQVGASHIRFHDVVIRNGAAITVRIAKEARDVGFESCEVYGSRYGAFIAGCGCKDGAETCAECPNPQEDRGIAFENCLFDGGLAPWTTRVDVKANYEYCSVPDDQAIACEAGCTGAACEKCCPQAAVVGNDLGKKTSDTLMKVTAAGTVFDRCTFRRGHDGVQIERDRVTISGSLFEDLNDEGIRLSGGNNLKVFKNLIRQTLNPFSFSGRVADCGSVYLYRNVIDQRVPVRGFHVLPSDAPAPYVWRYGADFKLANAKDAEPNPNTLERRRMPDIFVYHNTFIRHGVEGDGLTNFFQAAGEHAMSHRVFLNNILLGINLQQPFPDVTPVSPSPGACEDRTTGARDARGNVWYLYHRPPSASGCTGPNKNCEPRLANFDDEIFWSGLYLGQIYPSNSLRPAQDGAAAHAGVALPAGLEDSDPPDDGLPPDAGALKQNAMTFEAGAAASKVILPRPQAPTARARIGPDAQGNLLDDGFEPVAVTDANNDGFELVKINGSASTAPGAMPIVAVWSEGAARLATQAKGQLYLPEGEHYLHLTIVDSKGGSDTDGVRVRIKPTKQHGDNLLECPGFEEQACAWTPGGDTAAVQFDATAHTGKRALKLAPGAFAVQRVGVDRQTSYRVSAWVRGDPGASARMQVRFLGRAGDQLKPPQILTLPAVSTFKYREQAVTAPGCPQTPAAAEPFCGFWMELRLEASGGNVVFDDVRVLDKNLLRNAGFETRSPSGDEGEAPPWTIAAGGQIVVDAAQVRSGQRALALRKGSNAKSDAVIGLPAEPVAYRLSGWVKTNGAADTPKLELEDLSGKRITTIVVPPGPAGQFRYVAQNIVKPAGTTAFRLTLLPGGDGVTFDDLLLIPAN